MRIIVLATQNEKKRRELSQIVATMLPADVEVRTLADMGLSDIEIVEDGDTFAANARIKAAAVYAAADLRDVLCVMADDSGIAVDALEGAPGVRSARYAEDHDAGAGDEANNALLLRSMQGASDRRARFVCAIAMQIKDGPILEAFGEVHGTLAADERGDGGFGYDPLFIPVAYPERRMAELTPAQKHAISHRGVATRDVLTQLASHLSA